MGSGLLTRNPGSLLHTKVNLADAKAQVNKAQINLRKGKRDPAQNRETIRFQSLRVQRFEDRLAVFLIAEAKKRAKADAERREKERIAQIERDRLATIQAEKARLSKLERDRQARIAAEQQRVLQAKALAKRQAEAKAKALALEKKLALELATAKKLADAKAKILAQAKSDAEAKAKLKALTTAKSAQKAKADALAKAQQDVRIKTRNDAKAQSLLEAEAVKLQKEQGQLRIEAEAQLEKTKAGEPIIGKPSIIEKGGLLSIFDSSEIQSEVGPAFSTGEGFRISELEQRREDVLEKLEGTKALERLESGTSIFETGAGFNPVSIESGFGQEILRDKGKIAPETSEGIFISGQIQSQQVDDISDLLDIERQIGAISTEIPGTPESKQKPKGDIAGVRALESFEETKQIDVSPDLFPGSTIIGTAEEFGVDKKETQKIDGETFEFPALKGTLIGETLKPSEIAKQTGEDPFALATSFREETGLIAGDPVSFGNLLGFDTPSKPTKQKTPIPAKTILEGDIGIVTDAGLPFAEDLKIESGFIPFAPVPISSSVTSFGSTAKRPTRSAQAPVPFLDFLGDVGSSLGISSDLFASLSSRISFADIFGTSKPATIARPQASRALEVKQARADRAGFEVGPKGNVFSFTTDRRGTKTLVAKGKTVAEVKAKVKAKNKARLDAIFAEEKRRKAARTKPSKRRKRTTSTGPLGRVGPASLGRATVSSNIFSVGTTSTRSTSRSSGKKSRTTRTKIRNPFESFGFGDQSGFI